MNRPLSHGFRLAAIFIVGCAVDAGEGFVARFDPAAAEQGVIGAVPFPSDRYRDPGGELSFSLPADWGDAHALEAAQRALLRRRGFCTTCAVRFEVVGALDPASLPGWSLQPPTVGDPVVLVDVDPTSPEWGQLVPLTIHWDEEHRHVTARPRAGVSLRPDTRYAAAMTDAFSDIHGSPLQPSPWFAAESEESLAVLDGVSVPTDHIVSTTVFTTGRPSRTLAQVRRQVHDAPAPALVIDRIVLAGPELDALLGTTTDSRPGVDVPPVGEGSRSVRHETTRWLITGSIAAPRFVEGRGSEVGRLRRDEAGAPSAGPQESVPFLLLLPRNVDITRLPVVVALHGFNSSRTLGLVYADTAGSAGAAVFAIDAYQHGLRAASATDDENTIRGTEEPDGFAEASALDVTARVLGVTGVPVGTELDPEYPVAAFVQFAADAMSAIRFVRSGDLTPLTEAAPELAGLAFDPDRIFVAGNSLGAVVSASVLAVERDGAAYVLNVMPGSILDNLLESPEFRPVTDAVLLPLLGIRATTTPDDALGFHPLIDVYRWALEPIDPLALARRAVHEPIRDGPQPQILVQLAELDEVASPRAGEAFVAAAGIPIAYIPSHVSDEGDGDRAVDAIAHRFAGAGHGMLEVAAQTSRYEQPLPPFVAREQPVPIDNPIDAVHAQIEQFLRSRTESMQSVGSAR